MQGLGAPTARRLRVWEQAQADALLADVFGYHALQVGWPELDALRANRMPHRWVARTEFEPPTEPGRAPDLWLDSRAWPWPADSLDLVVLPHTLERSADPHACLREVERVLIPEGQVFITGINPLSWWGWRQRRWMRQQSPQPSQPSAQLVGYHRLRDWLRLLGFEVQLSRFEGGSLATPMSGSAYLIVATKRVPGGRLLSARNWRAVRSPAAVVAPAARTDAACAVEAKPRSLVIPQVPGP